MTRNAAIKVLQDKELALIASIEKLDLEIEHRRKSLEQEISFRAIRITEITQVREAIKLLLQDGGAA